jgi:DNA-binding response OmpR family regulator
MGGRIGLPHSGMAMAHILLVEDDHQVSDLLSEFLEAAGHTVDCARTFGEAEERLAGSYDLLVCDVILPGGSGYQIAQRGEASGVRALLMTGYPDDMLSTARPPGAILLHKPFHADELMLAVENCLKLQRPGA